MLGVYRRKNDTNAVPLEIVGRQTHEFGTRSSASAFINAQLERGKACQRREVNKLFVVTVLTLG